MLHAAGILTLELASAALDDGMGLKDATPHNIMFEGAKPVILDVLSFEERSPRDPIWLAEAQFVRTFVLPLLAGKRLGLPSHEILLAHRDGIEPETMYRMLPPSHRVRPSYLGLVTIPTWFGASRRSEDPAAYRSRLVGSPEQARFVLDRRLRSLRRRIDAAKPQEDRSSVWSGYMSGNNNYSPRGFETKEKFVADVLREFRPGRVLDLGCNTGHFSEIAAGAGAKVVAIDYDPTVVGATWRRARKLNLDILPLVVNIARPTPALGWLNQECRSFLDRAHGRFDLVLMLALLHHLVVSERIPVDEVLACAAKLTTDLALIEFVGQEDSMFRRLTRGRDELHRDHTLGKFESACRTHFEIVRSQANDTGTRTLYLLRRKNG